MSYNPIFDAMRQAREDANAAHSRIDEDTEDSAEFCLVWVFLLAPSLSYSRVSPRRMEVGSCGVRLLFSLSWRG